MENNWRLLSGENNEVSPYRNVFVIQNVGSALDREFGGRNGVRACAPAEIVGK